MIVLLKKIRGLHRNGNSRFPLSYGNPARMGIDINGNRNCCTGMGGMSIPVYELSIDTKIGMGASRQGQESTCFPRLETS